MKNETPEDREVTLRLLKAAREVFEHLRVGMQGTVRRLQADEVDAAPTAQISTFHKSIQSVINIEADLDKRSYEQRSGRAVSVTMSVIPSHAQVIGVAARVISAITGAGVSSWSLGVSGAVARYGNGLGLELNSFAKGATGPMTYWADTALEITADAGSFAGGVVRLAVHFVELAVPRAV